VNCLNRIIALKTEYGLLISSTTQVRRLGEPYLRHNFTYEFLDFCATHATP